MLMNHAGWQFPVGAWSLLLAAAVLGCSGGDLVLPHPEAEIQLVVVSGDQQTGTVGEPLPKALTIELRDGQGDVVVGRKVAFTITGGPAEAALTPATAVTDGDGQALGQWVLGTKPGAYTAEARVLSSPDDPPELELPSVQLAASAVAGPPDTLRAESETNQAGSGGEPVPEPPLVRVVDRYGNPVEGVPVHWEVTSGRGSVSDDIVLTDAEGHATVTWTLGERIGVHSLSASVEGDPTGSPVVFTAVVFF